MLDRFASLRVLLGASVVGLTALGCTFNDQLGDWPPTSSGGLDGGMGQGCGPSGTERCVEPGGDCQTDVECTGRCVDQKCTTPTHTDGKKNLDETDVDCGGASAPACGSGRQCGQNDDCEGSCRGNVCVAPSATDGKKNADETDVDCGGTVAPAKAVA